MYGRHCQILFRVYSRRILREMYPLPYRNLSLIHIWDAAPVLVVIILPEKSDPGCCCAKFEKIRFPSIQKRLSENSIKSIRQKGYSKCPFPRSPKQTQDPHYCKMPTFAPLLPLNSPRSDIILLPFSHQQMCIRDRSSADCWNTLAFMHSARGRK